MTLLTTDVETSLWDFAQQVGSFALTLLSVVIAAGAVAKMVGKTPWWKRQVERRARERAERDRERIEATVRAVDEQLVRPLREKVDAIHHTTTVNGGKSNPPTLRDEVSSAVKVASLIAVNLADLSERMDQHEDAGVRYVARVREVLAEHGINLPEIDGRP